VKPVIVIAGAVALLAVGGGGAVLLMGGPHPATPAPAAPPPAAAPAPAAPDVAAKAPEPAPQPQAVLPPTVNFVPLVQDFSLVRDSAAFVSASLDAPQYYPLKSGTPLVSAARSPDGAWTVAMTADGRAAFIPSGDLGPYDPSRAPQPDLPQTVSGTAEVVDTGTLIVDGQTLPLEGVIGRKGTMADKMQALINAKGPQVSCTRASGDSYVCVIPPDFDLGRAAIFNGAAEASSDASDDYRAQQEAGKAAHRGIWQ
jgi:hypothetical protein